MRSVSGKEFAKALERRGRALLRVQGSHHIYGKGGSEVRPSVDVNQSLKTGLLRYLMKMAGLDESDL